jgi:type IV pilus assembly protein PilM
MGLFRLSSPTLVGLDIGSDRLKVVELSKAGRTYHLARMASAPSPSVAFRDGVPASPDEVGGQIRALVDKAGIRADRVVVGAGGQNVTVREVRVPPMTAQELTAAVRYEAERYLPYNVQDVHMDYQVMGESSEDGRKMLDVIVVATRRDVVQRIVETVEAARLSPAIMDVESFALFRSLLGGDGAEARTVVFIDLGAEASDIVISEGKRLRLTRNIPIGGNTLIHGLQETLSVDAATAKTMLEERGEILDENVIPDDLTVQRIHDTIAPQIGDLVTEIRRSLDYYQTRARAAVVSQIVLTGGLARLKNLSRVLAAELGLPVEIGNPFSGLDVNSATFPPDVLAAMGPIMSVAVGLALRGGEEA